MKVSVNINGVELKLDGEVDETVDFVRKLQEKEKQEQEQSIKEAVQAERASKTAELNTWQNELWNWLVDNDCENGIPIAGAARAFKINDDAMGQRLAKLVKMGYAWRPVSGRYRAKEK